MKIATWNVNSIRTRLNLVLDWLNTNPVEILCLQETKVIDSDFPQAPFQDLGYHLYISGQKTYNGVAIISKNPLQNVQSGFTPILGPEIGAFWDQQKRIITGLWDNLRVINLYVPNGGDIFGEKYDYKLSWLKVLTDYLQKLQDQSSQEWCICGDFNIAPEDRDIYDPKGKENHIMSSPPEREALQKICNLGLKDGFRKFTQATGYFTWWDYRRDGFSKNRGWRIDHHLLTPQLYTRALGCTIDRAPRQQEKPSDHAPVILEF